MMKYSSHKNMGLKGGPNHVQMSVHGYRFNSPDRFNPVNVIPSGRISMQGVPHPVMGVDDYGNAVMMQPGGEYQFPGNMVTEVPVKSKTFKKMAQKKKGGKTNAPQNAGTDEIIDYRKNMMQNHLAQNNFNVMAKQEMINAMNMMAQPQPPAMMGYGGNWNYGYGGMYHQQGGTVANVNPDQGTTVVNPQDQTIDGEKMQVPAEFQGKYYHVRPETMLNDQEQYYQTFSDKWRSFWDPKNKKNPRRSRVTYVFQQGGPFGYNPQASGAQQYLNAWAGMRNQHKNDLMGFGQASANLAESMYYNPATMKMKTKTTFTSPEAKDQYKEYKKMMKDMNADPFAGNFPMMPMGGMVPYYLQEGGQTPDWNKIYSEGLYDQMPSYPQIIQGPNGPMMFVKDQGTYQPVPGGADFLRNEQGNIEYNEQGYPMGLDYTNVGADNNDVNLQEQVDNVESGEPATDGTRRGNYVEPDQPANNNQVTTTQPAGGGSAMFITNPGGYPGPASLFPQNNMFNRWNRGRGMSGPAIAYNPANTFLDEYTYKGRLLGRGPRKVKMSFSHYGAPGMPGMPNAPVDNNTPMDDGSNLTPGTPDRTTPGGYTPPAENTSPAYNHENKGAYQGTSSGSSPANSTHGQMDMIEDINATVNDAFIQTPWGPIPKNMPTGDVNDPSSYVNAPENRYGGMHYQFGGANPYPTQPNFDYFNPINQYIGIFQAGGAAMGQPAGMPAAGEMPWAQTDVVWKRQGPGLGRDWADWGLAGMSFASSLAEGREARALEEQMKTRMLGDAQFMPTGAGDASRGTHTVNAGYQFPDQQVPVQFSGMKMGFVGSPMVQAQMGGNIAPVDNTMQVKPYAPGLDKEETPGDRARRFALNQKKKEEQLMMMQGQIPFPSQGHLQSRAPVNPVMQAPSKAGLPSWMKMSGGQMNYQEGGEYYLSDQEIQAIMQAGGQVELY